MSKADDILFFDVIFLIMVLAFSSTSSNPFDLSQFTNQIFAPWPSAPPLSAAAAQTCNWNDVGCLLNKFAGIGPLALIGGAVIWLVTMVYSFFARVIAFGNLVAFLMFNPALSASGVPFLPVIIVGLNVYVVWELIRTLRGSSTGV